jgi:hypothetical protein
LLIGTAFYTALAHKLVRHALWNRLNIIEINEESQLRKAKYFANITYLENKCEEVLPLIIE